MPKLFPIRRVISRVRSQAGAWIVSVLALVTLIAGVIAGERQARGARRPTDDALVLAEVPARARDPRQRELAALERRLVGEPRDMDVAVRVARASIELARREGDPRYLGRAQAALQPWWDEPAPADDEVLGLRAIVRQARHDFDGALGDLDRLVARAPLDAQAHLVRAGLLVLRGQPEPARASCQAIAGLVSPLAVAACLAPIEAAAGRAGAAAVALETALVQAAPEERAWGLSVLGELRFWAGELAEAERALRRALALDPGDRYTRALLADVLLDAGRAAEVRVALGADARRDEALLLRLAIAERRLGGDAADELADELRSRFEAERRRGDDVHAREEARFLLEVDDQPTQALAAAQRNWQHQREPWDERLLRAAERAVAHGREGGKP